MTDMYRIPLEMQHNLKGGGGGVGVESPKLVRAYIPEDHRTI